MKRILFLLLIAGLTYSAQSQSDRIFLKNGSSLKGWIVGDRVSDTLTFYIDSVLIDFPISLIAEIYPARKHHIDLGQFTKLEIRRGWSSAASIGFASGKERKDDPVLLATHATVEQMYHFTPLLNVGLSVGFIDFEDFQLFPVAIEYYSLFKGQRGLLVYGAAGGSFIRLTDESIFSDAEGDLFAHVGLGFQSHFGKSALQYRVGYMIQKLSLTNSFDGGFKITQNRRINRITIGIKYRIHY